MITKYTTCCIFCGRPTEAAHHLLNGPDRKYADIDGLTIPVCDDCHTDSGDSLHRNPRAMALSKMLGQMAFVKDRVAEGYTEDEAIELFRRRYRKCYF